VQQYDKLKEDLEVLNTQTTTLTGELAQVKAELQTFKDKNTEIRSYVNFMVQLISTQNSESLLSGEFDVAALADAKDELTDSAVILGDTNISYYVSLIDATKEAETAGAYYKAIEYCIKNIKQKLGTNGTSSNTGS